MIYIYICVYLILWQDSVYWSIKNAIASLPNIRYTHIYMYKTLYVSIHSKLPIYIK